METVLWVPMFLSIVWCLFILGCPPLLAGLSLTCFYTCWLLGKVPSQTRPGFLYLRINLKSLTVWDFHRDAQESAFPREKSNLSLSLYSWVPSSSSLMPFNTLTISTCLVSWCLNKQLKFCLRARVGLELREFWFIYKPGLFGICHSRR